MQLITSTMYVQHTIASSPRGFYQILAFALCIPETQAHAREKQCFSLQLFRIAIRSTFYTRLLSCHTASLTALKEISSIVNVFPQYARFRGQTSVYINWYIVIIRCFYFIFFSAISYSISTENISFSNAFH